MSVQQREMMRDIGLPAAVSAAGTNRLPNPVPNAARRVATEPEWVDTTAVEIAETFTVLDLCCGCGGFTLGFRDAGFLPLLGIDGDRWAVETFGLNFPGVPILLSPVEKLTDSEILAPLEGLRPDVICSGLPCTGFSTNGKQKAEDPRNWLFTQLARVVELTRPHVVAVENVPRFIKCHDGRFYRWLSTLLAGLGYRNISVATLNAAAYGVPQSRKRAIILATRHGFPNRYPVPLFAEAFFTTIDAGIGDLQGLPQGGVPDHEWPEPGEDVQARIDALTHGRPLSAKFTGGCRRLRPDEPAFTVMANNGQPHIHPHEHRFSSVREMARLQGFPDSFVFAGPVREKQKQVGNAIPPPLARHVALALRSMLTGGDQR